MTKKLFILPGAPIILKNSKQIRYNRKTGKRFIGSSDRATNAKKTSVMIMASQNRGPVITEPVEVTMTFCGAWNHGGGNVPDLSNLYQYYEDCLQSAGVIADDRLIESHDSSRRVYMCDTCHKVEKYTKGPNKGQRKKHCGAVRRCPYQRVEIEVKTFDDTGTTG